MENLDDKLKKAQEISQEIQQLIDKQNRLICSQIYNQELKDGDKNE